MLRLHLTAVSCCLLIAASLLGVAPAQGLDANHQAQADAAIERGLDFLRQNQNPDGSWTPQPGPAVTGLVLAVMLDQPDLGPDDPVAAKAIEYLLSKVQLDGSIRDGAGGILANYNTAICLSALSRIHDNPDVATAVRNAQRFLKDLQWSVGDVAPDGKTITADHPYAGGAGYGKHGRPDLSNTQFMLQGLFDSGVDCDDPAFINAIRFIERCQGIEENNYFPKGTIVNDGGVIYATAINKEHPDIPVSYANPDLVDEARAGRPVSGLRGYGSITYAAFKSFLYANLDRDDPRVVGALQWIQNNYTLERNPGLPPAIQNQGLYYYYMTHARALSAYGNTHLTIPHGPKTATLHAPSSTPVAEVMRRADQLQSQGYTVSFAVTPAIPHGNEATNNNGSGSGSGYSNNNGNDDDTPNGSTAEITVTKSTPMIEIDWANRLIAKLASLQKPDGSFLNDESRWMEDNPNLVTAYALIDLARGRPQTLRKTLRLAHDAHVFQAWAAGSGNLCDV